MRYEILVTLISVASADVTAKAAGEGLAEKVQKDQAGKKENIFRSFEFGCLFPAQAQGRQFFLEWNLTPSKSSQVMQHLFLVFSFSPPLTSVLCLYM